MTRKWVLGSGDVRVAGGGGDDARAATVREAVVPLWAARKCGAYGSFERLLRVKTRREVVRTADIVDVEE